MRYCPSCGARFSQEVSFCPHDGVQTRELPEQEPPKDPLIGRVIDGRYEVEAQIGEGGMGIVYLATHTVLGKKLALKVLRGEMARDAEVVQRFIQEAQTASSIGHSNIVDISDFGRLEDGAVYFAMEYLDGEPLTTFITRGGSIPMSEAIEIIEQMASAVGAAHARGVVHRDLKPDNVFILRRSGELVVKVLDFGIAKVGDANTKLTQTGMVFGTPHYMSPEQAAGHSVDGRTDIYAIGVIMYEMFTGHVPFDADTFMGILSKHMFEQPKPPSEAGHGRQLGAIEDVILKALRKKPEERYQNMDEMLADLAAIQAGGTVSLGAPAGRQGSESLANALEPPSRTEMRLSRPDGQAVAGLRKPLIALAVAAVVVFVAGLAAVVLALRGGAEQAQAGGPLQEPVAASEDEAAGGGASADDAVGGAEEAEAEGLPAGKEPPAQPSRVMISSDPTGAQMFIDGAMVGNTPARLSTPEEDELREVVLKKRGYEEARVALNAESPESITVSLERKARRARAPRRPRTSKPRPPAERTSESSPEPEPEPEVEPMVTREVVDPWAQ